MPNQEVLADKGYGRGPTYSFLREKGIRAYIPLHNDNIGEGRISRGEFKYDRRNDRFICPKGKALYPYEKLERGMKRYRVVGGHCQSCLYKTACLPESYKNRARFVYRSPYQDEIDKIRKRQGTAHFRKNSSSDDGKLKGCLARPKKTIVYVVQNIEAW